MNTKEQSICIKCQECCNWVTFTLEIKDGVLRKNLTEFYIARGFTIHEQRDSITVMIKTKCPHLTKFGCAIYSIRPKICKLYDGREDQHMKAFCKLPDEFDFSHADNCNCFVCRKRK